MIVIRVDVDRIEVHARGLTAEPFGTGRTLLERQPARIVAIYPDIAAGRDQRDGLSTRSFAASRGALRDR